MTQIVEVTARLGDSIVSVAHGASVTVGQSGDIYAPIDDVTFAIDDCVDHSRQAGLLTLDIRRVSAATDRVPRARPEGRPAAYIAVSLLVHLALWGTASRAHSGDGEGIRTRYAHVLPGYAPPSGVIAAEDGEPSPAVSMSLSEPREGVGPVAELAGHASVDIVDDRGALSDHRRDHRNDETEARRASAIAFARKAGVLGAEALRGEHPLGDIPGTGSPASGFDGRSIDGAARGDSAHAEFASDRRLRGGCVGPDCGVIGTGRYGVVCGGSTPDAPCAGGYGAGYGVHMRGHETRAPEIHLCGRPDMRGPSPCVAVVGELDKSIIRRYMRRKLGALQACYERALLNDANLSGVIDLSFVIDATGHTHDITAKGVRADVESCVATVIESIQFPQSRNGGFTQVHYPFEFRVAGS